MTGHHHPDDVAPGLNPGALVFRLVAPCGAVLVPLSPLGTATDTPDMNILATHHADMIDLHRTQCGYCHGFLLLLNDGDDGRLVAADMLLEIPGAGSTLIRIHRLDYGC